MVRRSETAKAFHRVISLRGFRQQREERISKMTTLRKWRFPILIGSGLIAAGALVYFSNGHVSTEKTQGAIGQRDVYRDGQVNSADVATPGSAPVANEAILQSSEFKALAKNPAFQEVMRADVFNENHTRKAMADLFADKSFVAAAQDERFAQLVNSATFQAALKAHSDLFVALKSEMRTMDLRKADTNKADTNKADLRDLGLADSNLKQLLKNESFRMLARQEVFQNLLASSALRASLQDKAFASMASHEEFQRALESGAMTRAMSASMLNRALSESSKK